jgi:hypothetical protein
VFRLWTAGVDVHVAATPEREEDQPTDDVIEIGDAILRDSWNSRWPKHPRWLARRLHGTTPPTL